jgi:hypothetical protein
VIEKMQAVTMTGRPMKRLRSGRHSVSTRSM